MLRRPSFYIGLLLAIAMLVSAWLLASVLLSASAGTCETGCDELVHGHWGKFVGVPVSALGLMIYLVLFWVNSQPLGNRRRLVGRMAAGLVLGAAFWFTGLQIWLGQFCPYCCSAHACAVIAALLWLRCRDTVRIGQKESLRRPNQAVAIGAASVVVVASVQIALQDQATTKPSPPRSAEVVTAQETSSSNSVATQRELVLHAGRFHISLAELPIIGSPQADQLGAMLFDFTCPHCRQMHADVAARLSESGESSLATVLLPVPRNTKAAAVHRLMLALWREMPDAYEQISHRLVSGQLSATEENVRQAIIAVIGEQVLAQRLATDGEWIQAQIDRAQAIRVANHPAKTLGVPQLMVGGEVLVGFDSPRDVAQFLADNAGLRPGAARSEVEIEVVEQNRDSAPDESVQIIPAPSSDQPPTTIPLVMSAAPLRSERVQVVLINVVGTDAETVKVTLPASLADLGVKTQTGSRTSSGKVPVRLSFPKGFQAPDDSLVIQIDAIDGSRSSTLVSIERAQ